MRFPTLGTGSGLAAGDGSSCKSWQSYVIQVVKFNGVVYVVDSSDQTDQQTEVLQDRTRLAIFYGLDLPDQDWTFGYKKCGFFYYVTILEIFLPTFGCFLELINQNYNPTIESDDKDVSSVSLMQYPQRDNTTLAYPRDHSAHSNISFRVSFKK